MWIKIIQNKRYRFSNRTRADEKSLFWSFFKSMDEIIFGRWSDGAHQCGCVMPETCETIGAYPEHNEPEPQASKNPGHSTVGLHHGHCARLL